MAHHPNQQQPHVPVTVARIMPDAHDAMNARILTVFQKHVPHYAIYSTAKRLGIQFADDEDEQKAQRKLISDLYALRGEINGLVNGWRSSDAYRKRAAAERYDRRVADALTIGLEGDIANARTLLLAVRQDLINERTGNARVQYLLIASGTVLAVFVAINILSHVTVRNFLGLPSYTPSMLVACWAGTLGAFFSIAVAIRTRTILTDLHFGNNTADAILRIAVGLIAAFIVICLVKTRAVTIFVGDTSVPNSDDLSAIITGFLAGFSERLLPDLLAKAAAGAVLATPPAAQDTPPQSGVTPPAPQAEARATLAAFLAPGGASHEDACLCEHPVAAAEATPDTELPQAYGGVAAGPTP